jgi:hypothetical protein
MCTWHRVFWIYCRHRRKKVIKCIAAEADDSPCDDWDDEENKREALTHDGRPYTQALVDTCPECKWDAMLDAMDERELRTMEEREREKELDNLDRLHYGTNGTHGTNRSNRTNGTNGTNGTCRTNGTHGTNGTNGTNGTH